MARLRTCGKEFLLGLSLSGIMLGLGYLFAAIGLNWRFVWIWYLAAFVLLVPVFPNPGQLMGFAIARSLDRARMWGVAGYFLISCVTLYFAFTKALAAVNAGLFLMFGALIAAAYWVRRKKLSPDTRPMDIAPMILAIGAYLTLLVLAFCGVFISAVETGKAAARVSVPPAHQQNVRRVDGLVDLRGQIHVHSRLSHDAPCGDLDWITLCARDKGISWIVFTDHISKLPEEDLPRNLRGVELIYGQERRAKVGGSQLNAPLGFGQVRLHTLGHLELADRFLEERWDALELVNYHANALEAKWRLARDVFFCPDKIYDELDFLRPENLRRWQRLAEKEGRPIPIYAGPDAHSKVSVLGCEADPYGLIFSRLSTHIWLGDKEALSQNSVLSAIQKGRTYIAFESLGDPTGFQFWAERGQYRFFTGEDVRAPWWLFVRPPSTTDCEIRVYRDNALIASRGPGPAAICDFQIEKPEPGFWRVEICRKGRLWVISGQILIK